MEQKRPLGVTVVAIIALLNGLIGICCPSLFIFGSSLVAGLGGFIFGFVGWIGIIAGVFMILGPVLQLAFAYGAFKMKKWAWWLGVIATGLPVIGAILNIISGAPAVETLASIAISLLIFVYLLTPKVGRAFRI